MSEHEELSGNIERITFHNEDNGFCVLKVNVQGCRELITITGSSPNINIGENIKCIGKWHNDRKYGKQFKADSIQFIPPNTLEAIEKYLGSGLIKGIGPHLANKLVNLFGKDVFDIIEKNPELLENVEGIGKSRAKNICKNWQNQKAVSEIIIFLQSHGIGTSKATRIFKIYGKEAIQILSQNPYQLTIDIKGIGFLSADKIAQKLGIAKNAMIRVKAGVAHILSQAASSGHCALPSEILIDNTRKLLTLENNIIEEAIEKELKLKSIICDFIEEKSCIFLSNYYFFENKIAEILHSMNCSWSNKEVTNEINNIEKKLNIKLAEKQKIAINKALSQKLMVITGGPGTGKTTLVKFIITLLKEKNINIKLCAPTGRAAKRLTETSGIEATTIHRLLEVDAVNGGFKYNKDNKLNCDYIILDETSMVDIILFYSLLKAIPQNACLLLVGDVDQLPSIGPGQVLKDIIESDIVPTIRLQEIFRQSATSKIIINAHNINKGILPDIRNNDKLSDFYFISAEQGDDITNKIIYLVKEKIPLKFNLDPIKDIQILCPMQKGGTGAKSINFELQKAINKYFLDGITKFGQTFAIGDKVMQTENNYDKEIYNGDIGVIRSIDKIEQEIIINFYGNNIKYDYAELDQITLAYAITIHKSQGSEYPAIIIPITMQSYMMLKRNLLYTAVTRGKKLVIIIGDKKALAMAVRDSKSNQRYSKLNEWIQNNAKEIKEINHENEE